MDHNQKRIARSHEPLATQALLSRQAAHRPNEGIRSCNAGLLNVDKKKQIVAFIRSS